MIDQPEQNMLAAPSLDPKRQEKAREYAIISRRLMLAEMLLGGAYLLAWPLLGWHTALRDLISGWTALPGLQVALFAILFGLPYLIIDAPLSFYSGFVLPHRYGQSTQTLNGWLVDQVKGLAVSGLLGLIVLEALYLTMRLLPDLWWLAAAGVMLFFTVILAGLAPVLIAPLFYKFTPLTDDELTERLGRLAAQAGVQVQGVYRFDMSSRTKSANAALMGLGATRRIVLGDTLLDQFTADEIETVLAHELGHHVHRDIPLSIALNSVLTLISFYAAHLALTWAAVRFNLLSLADPAGLPLLALTLSIIGLIALPLSNGFARWRERLADRYALSSTGKGAAFAAAMTRLANQNLAEADPPAWVVFILHSHPPIRERVAAAQAFRGPGAA